MPFGLCNAPATFQRLMDRVLMGLQWTSCLVYIDDIIIVGKTFEEHLSNLEEVFKRLAQAGLKLHPNKCQFLQHKVHFLGHIISAEGITPDPSKSVKVEHWPVPTSVKETQQFLGLASYYRRFVKDFAAIAAPLHKLTEKTASFRWTCECQQAFLNLKRRLVSAPILALPDWSKPFLLDTDASDTGIGAVLSQIDGEKEHVIAYASRILTKAERNYCVTKRELLAVVTFLQHFRPYLLKGPFTLRTDHGALTWIQKFKEPEGQVARWLQKLQEYQFSIIHRPGKQHNNADALSRLPCRQCGVNLVDQMTTISPTVVANITLNGMYSTEDLRRAQIDDPAIGPLLKAMEENQKPSFSSAESPEYRRLCQLWGQLVLSQGLLYRMFEGPNDNQSWLQLIVPRKHRQEILAFIHEGPAGGHLGHEKTLGRLRERFYWPGYWNDSYNWCQACASCASRKSSAPSRRAPMGTITAGYPTQIMAIDLLGPLPESQQGNSYVMVVADYFTRWMEAIPIPNQEAATVTNKLVDEVFMRFSPPEQLHSDQGKQFESQLMAELCKLLHIKKTRTSPYHPQCDGMVERFNRTLLNMLAAHCEDHPWDWEQHVHKVCMAYNTSVHSSTGYTPFYLMFGRQARLPVDVIFGTSPSDPQSPSEYAVTLQKHLMSAYESVRKTGNNQHQRQKEYYDKKIHGDPHAVGDLVWVFNPKVPKNNHRKLFHPWTGPFKVLKQLSECTYRVQQLGGRKRRQIVHFNRLKPCPKDIRWNNQESAEKSNSDQEPDRSSEQEHFQEATPHVAHDIGKHVELLDDDGDELANTPIPNLPPRRYPQRTRHPPRRLGELVPT